MFTKEMLAGEVKFPITFPRLYKDEQGNPIHFNFTFRVETGADLERLERLAPVGSATADERRLARLSILLIEAPPEMSDFPKNGKSLAENVKDYFGDPRMSNFVFGALQTYDRIIMPEELFR